VFAKESVQLIEKKKIAQQEQQKEKKEQERMDSKS
jgi:hypothetical protein